MIFLIQIKKSGKSSIIAFMTALLISVSLISFFHALIPSHWLPITVISKNAGWSKALTMRATLYLGLAHVLSTVLLCCAISLIGQTLFEKYSNSFDKVSGVFLILYGFFFIFRHYTHHHFHFSAENLNTQNNTFRALLVQLLVLMFFSPCLEVVAVFFSAGKFGLSAVATLVAVYSIIFVSGMLLWVNLVQHGLKKINWHSIEHNAGLLTGGVLVIMGVFQSFGIGF